MEQEKKEQKGIGYKVNTTNTYKIKARTYGEKTFYNITLEQKKYDGTVDQFYRQVKFIKCDPPQDGECVKFIAGFESAYANPKDRYNWIPVFCITEYEKVDSPEQTMSDAFETFKQQTADVTITEEDLPF